MQQEAKTPVLLLCVQNKHGKPLSNDIFYSTFQRFGQIQRILIFEKQHIWKIFVEFDSIEAAQKAQDSLNGSELCHDPQLKMAIYGSQLERVVFQDLNNSGIDYTERWCSNEVKKNGSTSPILTKSIFLESDGDDQGPKPSFSFQPTQKEEKSKEISLQQFAKELFQFQSTFQFQTHQIQTLHLAFQNQAFQCQHQIHSNSMEQEELRESINSQVDLLQRMSQQHQNAIELIKQQVQLWQSEKEGNQQTSYLLTKSTQSKSPSIFRNSLHTSGQITPGKSSGNTTPRKNSQRLDLKRALCQVILPFKLQNNQVQLIEQDIPNLEDYCSNQLGKGSLRDRLKIIQGISKSRLIYARYFDDKVVSLRMIHNLFSLYGNIDKMIFLKEKSSALIQYFFTESAEAAKVHLQDLQFYGQQISIFFTSYEELILKSVYSQSEEQFKGNEETFRYNMKRKFVSVPQCDTLYVMNLPNSLTNKEKLFSIFGGKYGQIKDFKFIIDPNHKHQAAVLFESLDLAIQALVENNGIEIDGRRIIITFSKERL